MIGRLAGAADDRQGRRDTHGAWIAHHQHAKSGEHSATQIGLSGDEPWPEHPADEGERGNDEHARRVHAQDAINEM